MPYHNFGSCEPRLSGGRPTVLGRQWTYLGVGQEVERLLISRISLLQIILHEITVPCARAKLTRVSGDDEGKLTKCAPDLAVFAIEMEGCLPVLDRTGKVVAGACNAGDAQVSCDRVRVVLKRAFVCVERAVDIAHLLGNTTYAQG